MLFLAHSGGSGTESTGAATAAPVPRSVGVAVAWLNSGNVATPVMQQPSGCSVDIDRDHLPDMPPRIAQCPFAEHHLTWTLRWTAGQHGEEIPAVQWVHADRRDGLAADAQLPVITRGVAAQPRAGPATG